MLELLVLAGCVVPEETCLRLHGHSAELGLRIVARCIVASVTLQARLDGRRCDRVFDDIRELVDRLLAPAGLASCLCSTGPSTLNDA